MNLDLGPSRSIYGHDALTRALHDLHGYYRSSHVLEQCNQWEDWRSMIEIFTVEKQWSQVISMTNSVLLALSPTRYYFGVFIT